MENESGSQLDSVKFNKFKEKLTIGGQGRTDKSNIMGWAPRNLFGMFGVNRELSFNENL